MNRRCLQQRQRSGSFAVKLNPVLVSIQLNENRSEPRPRICRADRSSVLTLTRLVKSALSYSSSFSPDSRFAYTNSPSVSEFAISSYNRAPVILRTVPVPPLAARRIVTVPFPGVVDNYNFAWVFVIQQKQIFLDFFLRYRPKQSRIRKIEEIGHPFQGGKDALGLGVHQVYRANKRLDRQNVEKEDFFSIDVICWPTAFRSGTLRKFDEQR
ncbi:hypothetical protein [Cohnella hongkongensis]|uniref:Uncharacterized protein n=1 Tax=Cohnella hongkongensis TaxID=178337 RepID=A0ABV9F9B7_9BACL